MKKHLANLLVLSVTSVALVGCVSNSAKASKTAAPAVPTLALNELDPDTTSNDYSAGMVMKWQVLGPFSFESKPYKKVEEGCEEAVDDPFIENEATLQAGQAVDGAEWKEYDAFNEDGHVNIDDLYDEVDYAAAYLVANVKSPKDVEGLQLLLGSDDYLRVWVNGKEVFTYMQDLRGAVEDSDVAEGISLKKGWNTIVMKVVDVYGGWGAYCRIANSEGKALVVK